METCGNQLPNYGDFGAGRVGMKHQHHARRWIEATYFGEQAKNALSAGRKTVPTKPALTKLQHVDLQQFTKLAALPLPALRSGATFIRAVGRCFLRGGQWSAASAD
jgi:hypothetical protein